MTTPGVPAIQARLQAETGLCLSADTVERAVRQRMGRRAIERHEDYVRSLSPAELQALVELVVVPESWMFRDRGAFDCALRFVQERLAAHPGRPVRILCIPCAGGEEPYSMAMALADAGVPAASCRIEGIDLSSVAVERARHGLYTRNAFRGQDLGFRERHFTAEGEQYRIGQRIRDMVRFSEGNLMHIDTVAAAHSFDVVFCRNLLIYFDAPTASAAVARLHALLADDGLLLAGYAEVPAFCRNGFTPLRLPGAFALQKESAAAAAALARPVAPAAAPPGGPSPVRRAAAAVVAAARRATAPARAASARQKAPEPAAPDLPALLAQARQQADLGQLAQAAASCHAALAADPASAQAYFILGVVSECERRTDLAQDYWRRCVYLQPDHYEALCSLALLAEAGADHGAAAALRERAARVYRRHEGAGGGPA